MVESGEEKSRVQWYCRTTQAKFNFIHLAKKKEGEREKERNFICSLTCFSLLLNNQDAGYMNLIIIWLVSVSTRQSYFIHLTILYESSTSI